MATVIGTAGVGVAVFVFEAIGGGGVVDVFRVVATGTIGGGGGSPAGSVTVGIATAGGVTTGIATAGGVTTGIATMGGVDFGADIGTVGNGAVGNGAVGNGAVGNGAGAAATVTCVSVGGIAIVDTVGCGFGRVVEGSGDGTLGVPGGSFTLPRGIATSLTLARGIPSSL